MRLTPRAGPHQLGNDGDLHVLFTRLLDAADRPPPTEEDIDAFESIDPALDEIVREHVERFLGPTGGTWHDTQGPFLIDVGLTEPADERPWGACFTVGTSAHAMPSTDTEQGNGPSYFELFLRLPAEAFRYWKSVVLEPFDTVIDALGELGRLPHERRVGYRPPQIVATPDRSPLVAGLPFAGVLLRDATAGRVPVPELPMPGGGSVAFLSVTFLHASEIRALVGPERARAAIRLAAAGVDELLAPERAPVL